MGKKKTGITIKISRPPKEESVEIWTPSFDFEKEAEELIRKILQRCGGGNDF